MYILGDIGNTETKLCIVSKKNKISKKITFLSKSVNSRQLNILFKKNKIQFSFRDKRLRSNKNSRPHQRKHMPLAQKRKNFILRRYTLP